MLAICEGRDEIGKYFCARVNTHKRAPNGYSAYLQGRLPLISFRKGLYKLKSQLAIRIFYVYPSFWLPHVYFFPNLKNCAPARVYFAPTHCPSAPELKYQHFTDTFTVFEFELIKQSSSVHSDFLIALLMSGARSENWSVVIGSRSENTPTTWHAAHLRRTAR